MKPHALRLATTLATGIVLAAGTLCAAEIGAAHLVFEKSAKIKKIEAALYLTWRPDEARQLSCGVMARGKRGSIPVAGSLALRLVGESANGGEVWRSGAVDLTLDNLGGASFAPADLARLAAEADAAAAAAQLLRVDFKGGRGGRATELTMDCLYEPSGT